jgi:hypothetical protein
MARDVKSIQFGREVDLEREPDGTVSWVLGGSASICVHVHALQFLDFGDCDRASSVSLEHRAGCLHILSYKGHHLFTLVGIGHVRRDWEIDQPGLGEDDDWRAVLNAIQGALQAEAGGGPSRILDGTSEVPNSALYRHRLGVGCHLSTLMRERWKDKHHRKSRSKEYMKQSGALHIHVQDLQVQIHLRLLGGANAGFRGHISGLAAETGTECIPCRVHL